MGKIDVYIRSIEKFGAAGAILTSGQAVTLRFPTGDRHATQVTPHDQLVMLVREVAPATVMSQVDANRPARFELDSAGARYQISVRPGANAWQVFIEPATIQPQMPSMPPMPSATPPSGINFNPPTTPPVGSQPKPAPVRSTNQFGSVSPNNPPSSPGIQPGSIRSSASQPAIAPNDEPEMYIERGQYEAPSQGTSSGSALLDLLTSQARAAAATDVYLAAGAPAFMRVNGQLVATQSRSAIDADLLSRELGVIAPPHDRETWLSRGQAMFTYSDGLGRIRVTLTRDHRGPGASLRLLFGDPPTLEQLGLGEVENMLEGGGLVLIGGRSGVGKTTTLSAMLRWLGENRRRVVSIEDPIEIVHLSPWISQRQVGMHVPDVKLGVEAAMQEGADAVVIGAATTAAAASAVIEAAIGGHLVLTTVVSPVADKAAHRLVDRLPADQRAGAWSVISDMLVGAIAPMVGAAGDRTFEVAYGPPKQR
jgi:twitching motility protein PilT